MTGAVPVLAAALLDPGHRIELDLPAGLTVAAMIDRALPGLPAGDRGQLRVTLVTEAAVSVVPEALWRHVRPKPGVRLVIRLVPGKDGLRSVLTAIVTVAAMALGQVWATALIPTAGLSQTILRGVLTAGLTIVGNALVNALIPIQTPDSSERRDTYSITGWRNAARPGEPVPYPLGRHRYAPPFAAGSYTEIVGNDQYVRALFCCGYGPVSISDIRIGDTPVSEYDEVEIETREGRAGDDPVTLYPRQVLEQAEGLELVRPLPRDDAGEPTGDPGTETPLVRYTAADTESVSAILAFPGGLFRVNDDGDEKSLAVSIRIRQRPEGGGAWTEVVTLDISARERSPFFRQHSWTLPSRGRWEIEVTRMTDERTDTRKSDRTVLSALQSVRPEYPLNMAKPLALIAVRMKATHQLNGSLESLNCILERYADTWDGSDWDEALTRNPASAYLSVLRGPLNPYPVTDAEIDLEAVADWYDFCTAKGLKYDRVHDRFETLGEALAAICGAGRASPHHDGLNWGVVIDRPQALVIDHVNPRNSADFSWQRTYFDPPDAIRVTFFDETNGHEQAERVIPWPGHVGPIDLTEELSLPGKTDPDEVWIETRRRMYELVNRPDQFSAVQEGAARVATRGDLVMGSYDTLDRTQLATRVRAVAGRAVELEEPVTMAEGTGYAIRFRVYDAEDVIGTSVVRQVTPRAATSALLLLSGEGEMPAAGDLVHFGELATESLALRVRGVEAGEGFSAVLHMVAAAPEIDTLTDAEVPPAWNGRVGAEIDPGTVVPATPYFTSIATGLAGTGDADGLEVLVAPGGGSAVAVSTFRVEHKLDAAGSWDAATFSSAEGGGAIAGYASGDVVDLRCVAIAYDGSESAASTEVTVTIGADDPDIPAALDDEAITATGGLGSTAFSIATTDDPATARLQLYRVPTGDTLVRDLHAAGAPFAVNPSTTVGYVDGDATRSSLVANGGFTDASGWTLGANWSISGGLATHAAGAADAIERALSLGEGIWYRLAVTVSGRTGGALTPQLTGGTAQSGSAVSENGLARDRIQAVPDNDTLTLAADASFDGSIDDVVLFVETSGCVDAGDYDYYLEPQTVEGVPGPVAGPFFAEVL